METQQPESKKWLTMRDLGSYLGISRSTIYLMIRNRELPFTPMSKRAYRFDKERIDKWMATRAVGTVDEALKKTT